MALVVFDVLIEGQDMWINKESTHGPACGWAGVLCVWVCRSVMNRADGA